MDRILSYLDVMDKLHCSQNLAYELMYRAGASRLGVRKGLRVKESSIDAIFNLTSTDCRIPKDQTRKYTKKSEISKCKQ